MSQSVNGLPVNNLDDLEDVNAENPTDGQALVWDSLSSKWIPAPKLDPDGNGSQLTGITTLQIDGLDQALIDATDNAIASINSDPSYVRTNESYSDPSWITSLSGSKVSPVFSGNASTTGEFTVGLGAANPTLNFGGETNSFPALVSDGIDLECLLADLSGYAPFNASVITASVGFSGNGTNITGVVHTTGDETINGVKTFTDVITGRRDIKANTVGGGATPIHIGTTGVAGQSIYPGIWFTAAAPTITNYAFLSDAGVNTILNAPAGGFVALRVGNITYVRIDDSGPQINDRPLNLVGSTSTSQYQPQGSLRGTWADSTDATRKGMVTCNVIDASGTRQAWRAQSDGTQALLSFFGNAAVAKPTVTGSRAGNAALASLLTALASLGLITDSTTS